MMKKWQYLTNGARSTQTLLQTTMTCMSSSAFPGNLSDLYSFENVMSPNCIPVRDFSYTVVAAHPSCLCMH